MLSMFDLSEHQLATISTWAEVAILAFMVWEKYGPHFLGGAGQLTAQQPAAGIWWALWANRTLMVAIAGMGIMVWLNLRVPLPNEFGEFTNPQLVQVTNETFRNRTVDIDGIEFIDCIFDNVTLRFQGKRGFRFTNIRIPKGSSVMVASTNPIVMQTGMLLSSLEKAGAVRFGDGFYREIEPPK